MKILHKVAFVLLIVGGLNWGVFALLGWDVSQLIGGVDSLAAKVVYIVVGLSAVYEIFGHRGRCRECVSGPQS